MHDGEFRWSALVSADGKGHRHQSLIFDREEMAESEESRIGGALRNYQEPDETNAPRQCSIVYH